MKRLRAVTTLWLAIFASALGAEHAPIVVAADGSGQFKTVQSALDAIPDENREERVIIIKPGTYKARVRVYPSKTFVTLRGEAKDAARTILTFDRYAGMDDPEAPGSKVTTASSETASIEGNNFTAENITFENSATQPAQAVAVHTLGDKQIFRNCRFLGRIDTLFVDGQRIYFHDCYIEGRLDFIFGLATAVFENCQVHTLGSVITAASTKPETPFGLVFLKCKLTGAGGKAYLGKPWQTGAATAFIECLLGDHIRPEGWGEWPGTENHKTARYFEYRNTGPGANPGKRAPWTRQLSDAEAKLYTIENILGGQDGWNPKREGPTSH